LFPMSSRRLLSLIRIQTNARAHVRSAHAKSSGTNLRQETHTYPPLVGNRMLSERTRESAKSRIHEKYLA
jgi:hypothetical protein